jgi:hypothetical protein
MNTEINLSTLHHALLNHLLEHGYAPDIVELAAQFKETDLGKVKTKLQELEAHHGVVLHPNKERVWVIHPLSTAPTNFAVKCNGKVHWGNCAWCSLGVAALLQPAEVKISTTCGAEGQPLELVVRDGRLITGGYVVHFPVPMSKAWENVVYTCSVMLLFRNEQEVDSWCFRHHIAKGDVQPAERVWAFAREWYSNHLSMTWRKWTNEEAARIFENHGLAGFIWEIPRSAGRF